MFRLITPRKALILIITCMLGMNNYTFADIGVSSGPGPSTPSLPSASNSNQYGSTICATTYTVYLTETREESFAQWDYGDNNYGNHGGTQLADSAPPTTSFLGPAPAAGVPVPPYNLPLCPGTYNVAVAVGVQSGSCGGGTCGQFKLRLYAGYPNGGQILIGDAAYVGGPNQHTYNAWTGLNTTWKTSQGTLYPPFVRGGGSDSYYVVPGKDSYITVTWTGP